MAMIWGQTRAGTGAGQLRFNRPVRDALRAGKPDWNWCAQCSGVPSPSGHGRSGVLPNGVDGPAESKARLAAERWAGWGDP